MEPLSVKIQEFEDKIVSIINETNLHPAIAELAMRNIYNQVKEAVIKQTELEKAQNNSELTTAQNNSESEEK